MSHKHGTVWKCDLCLEETMDDQPRSHSGPTLPPGWTKVIFCLANGDGLTLDICPRPEHKTANLEYLAKRWD